MTEETQEAVHVATTWNKNPGGTVWERLWYRDAEGGYSQLIATGVFSAPVRYATEEGFQNAIRAEMEAFGGMRNPDVT